MDRERFLELDRSGKGLTDEEYAQGFHWCYEWDQMLVGPGQPEALVCSCDHPKIEEWKQSDEAKQMLREQEERMKQRYGSQEAMEEIAKLDEELGLNPGQDALDYFANMKMEADENNNQFRKTDME